MKHDIYSSKALTIRVFNHEDTSQKLQESWKKGEQGLNYNYNYITHKVFYVLSKPELHLIIIIIIQQYNFLKVYV